MVSIELRPKGQITIPAEIRSELQLQTGDRLVVSRDGDRIVLERQMDIIRRLAGIFDDYIQDDSPVFDRDDVWADMAEDSLKLQGNEDVRDAGNE